jgi:hypothetical protein
VAPPSRHQAATPATICTIQNLICHCTLSHPSKWVIQATQDHALLWYALLSCFHCAPEMSFVLSHYFKCEVLYNNSSARGLFPDHLSTTANHTPSSSVCLFLSTMAILTPNHAISFFFMVFIFTKSECPEVRGYPVCPGPRTASWLTVTFQRQV